MNIKDGWKTTEFWMTIGTAIIGILMAFGVFTEDTIGHIEKIIGGLVTLVTVASYSLSRGRAKAATVSKDELITIVQDVIGQYITLEDENK